VALCHIHRQEAALIDGASRFRRSTGQSAWRRGPAATAIFHVLLAWNDFSLAGPDSGEAHVTPYIGGFITDKVILWGRLYASSAIIMVPVLVFGRGPEADGARADRRRGQGLAAGGTHADRCRPCGLSSGESGAVARLLLR
jgi:hypothetical protein